MTTREQYEAVAKAIYDTTYVGVAVGSRPHLDKRSLVKHLARIFADDDVSFDPERFEVACNTNTPYTH